ncbi:MAG: low-specificity L-threonine aldolase [Myxococcaceae bacterium]|nr:low-specificity L-threonine aldolase [Myxococcaceae bacterium]
MTPVDLRSDTVTRPTPAMREAMLRAEVGDDVFGDDPTANLLEQRAAALLGFEAALFVPSGTQSNLCGLMAHCQRGDEYVVGQHAHTYKYEGGGAAVLGSIQPQPLEHEPDGTLAISRIEAAIKDSKDSHFARTRLLALENTFRGMVLPLSYIVEATAFARSRGLATHLDGARLFNAAVKSKTPARDIARHFDSVSVCLSKGLGAPVGSVLCGAQPLIASARRWRKVLGGGMRQSGMVAAAGLYALEHNVERLAEDHARAAQLAAGLKKHSWLKVEAPQTNMVFVHLPAERGQRLIQHLHVNGVLATGAATIRLVTHLDVDDAGIARALDAFARFQA